ncbi:minor extracellular serine protease Vpr [Caldalkalibacillus uzonensis]|uniref:Minor extracellular serine protease Vpr n=1 Tax=Caldalkalibacillus uzonensis TaxID=353224 RepID=A0ABU0CRP1_9BACI|nr:S8 family serine peptidase [Caldalkalibacillus uzonensis]MDQ0339029.1 minor extracellular serine protease Vpr [Caldalkalibacillus uzonensis]
MKKLVQHGVVCFLIISVILSSFGMSAAASQSGQASPATLASLYADIDLSSPVPTTVIVELEEESIVEAKHKGKKQSKERLAKVRGQVIKELQANVPDAKVNREYDFLFSGFSVELLAKSIPELLATAGVKAVYPNVEYKVDAARTGVVQAEEVSPEMNESAPYIGANQVWEELGVTGKGVTVAIIDTGVDYTHPDLAHAFGDYKGWDFVDNDDDPQETPPGDPRGGVTNHGTHVAGTVAANGQIKGVAPDAKLLAYRVLGPGGSGTTENVVAGIEQAVQDGANIMNLSLGNTLNNPDWATSIALDWAMAEGVVAVTSNGNSGPNNWTVGSPGTSRQAISVGATRLPHNAYAAELFTSAEVNYPSAKVMGFSDEEALLALHGQAYEFADVGLGRVQDFEGKDVAGKIALIKRGEIPFVDKAQHAKNAGAVGVIIYNHVPGEIPIDIPGMAVTTVKLSLEDGQKMLSELGEGNNTVQFSIEFVKTVGETVADFSSRGPVMDTWMIKPDVSAPGVNILSTIPTHNSEDPHGYAALQGTSMASPHVAGAAALLLEKHPDWTVEEVKAALMNTAEELFAPNGTRYPYNTQGAGSIRVWDAIQTEALLLPGSHSFGVVYREDKREVKRTRIQIQNLTDKTTRYEVEAAFAGNPEGLKVRTSRNLNVRSNGSQTVQVIVEADPAKLKAGYYEGAITLRNSGQELVVPTILFVQEPDYPRITHFYFEGDREEGYNLTVYLPGGAEELTFLVYEWTGSAAGDYMGHIGTYTDVPKAFSDYSWDGTIAGQQLESGQYALFALATKAGQTTQLGLLAELK